MAKAFKKIGKIAMAGGVAGKAIKAATGKSPLGAMAMGVRKLKPRKMVSALSAGSMMGG